MLPAEQTFTIAPLRQCAVNAQELEYIAFSGQHDIAHGIFRSLAKGERLHYANKYILHEVIVGGIKKLSKFLSVSAEAAAGSEKQFLDEVVQLFIESARATGNCSRELFESLFRWSEELARLSLLNESLRYYDDALAMGVNKFPDLYARCLVGKAGVLNTLGKFHETQSLLSSLAKRPYVITDRNIVPHVLFDLGKESLLKGDIDLYKSLLFKGLRHFYTSIETRRQFVDQVRVTYRHPLKLLFDRNVSFADKLLYAVHRCYFVFQRIAVTRFLGIARAMKFTILAYVYYLNYVLRPAVSGGQYDAGGMKGVGLRPLLKRRNVLVTRAMGGIGDLLMMTPAFHAYKNKFPTEEIHLAVPKRYSPVFQNNPDVTLLDIEAEGFEHYAYKKWFNFTDCPAARVESRTAPKVRRNRIELFARSLGIGAYTASTMEMRPRYFVSDDERAFQQQFWKENRLTSETVVGVQLHSDEVYRDYPHMKQLVRHLAQHYRVIVFDTEAITDLDSERIVRVEGLPMRKAFALVAACDAIVAPDSAFVHLAAAFDTPTVALFGPVDGAIRTKHYPNCVYLDVRDKLGCMPCWRNDKIPCKLTNMRTSVCMADISIESISLAVSRLLAKANTVGDREFRSSIKQKKDR